MERYRPHIGDMVWMEDKNPPSYAIMVELSATTPRWKDWTRRDSRPNAEVIDITADSAIIKYFNGDGTEALDFDFFSVAEDHVWKIKGDVL